MKVTVEKIDDINYIISGNVKNSIIEEKIQQLKDEAANDPEKKGSADEKYDNEAASQVFNDFIEAGVKEASIDPDTLLGQPGLKKYEKQEDSVYFEVYLATSPVIDTDIDLSDIVPSYTKPKADPKAVQAKLDAFAIQQAPFTKIDEDRPVVVGDIVVIDFEGFINDVPFEGGSATDFKLTVGDEKFIPGFEEQIVGMECLKDKTITVTFPENYQADDLAGKETQFVIKLHEIQEQKPAVIDDEFAQTILSKPTATVALLEEKFADQVISEELSNVYNAELKPKLLEGLLTKFEFTLPENIVEQEIDAKVREKLQGLPAMEQKVQMEDKDKFLALRDSVRVESRAGIKIALIVEALALKEGIDVDEQEVIAALGYQAMMAGQDAAELVQYYRDNNMMVSAKLGLTEDKLFGQILGFDK